MGLRLRKYVELRVQLHATDEVWYLRLPCSDAVSALALQASLGHGSSGAALSTARQQHRLSGHSYESGVASFTSSRLSYLSVASGSSHDSINRLPEDDESAYSSIVNFSELYENGYTVSRFGASSHECNSCKVPLQSGQSTVHVA